MSKQPVIQPPAPPVEDAADEPTVVVKSDRMQPEITERVKFDPNNAPTQVDFRGRATMSEAVASNPVNFKSSMSPRDPSSKVKDASVHFVTPMSPDVAPTEHNRVLQVALVWGDTILGLQHFADGVPVVIGEAAKAHFHIYSQGVGQHFVAATTKGSVATIFVPKDAGVSFVSGSHAPVHKDTLRAQGKLTGIPNGDSFQLTLADRAMVQFDAVSLMFRYVKHAPKVAVHRPSEEQNYTFFKITLMSILLFGALIASMFMTFRSDDEGSDDIFNDQSKYVKLLVKAEKKIEIKKLELSGVKEGAKPKDEEGKFGKKEVKKEAADPSKKGAPIVDANKREEDRKKVATAGLLAALNGSAGAASNVFGPGGLGTGINNALGGLQGGAGVGDSHGVGGLGSRGAGAGGGGTGLGLGGLGTKGSGRGGGGYGSIDLGGRGKDSVRVIPGKITVAGGLAKEVIDRIIRKHMNEIKFCYDQELQKEPNLAGKVAVMFTIDGTGNVAEANVSETTLSNSSAENCMLARIRRWNFPAPEGGTNVDVTYPWTFKPAGTAEE